MSLLSYNFEKKEAFQGSDIELEFSLDVDHDDITDIKLFVVIKNELLGTIEHNKVDYNSTTENYSVLIPGSFTEDKVGDMLVYIEVKYNLSSESRVYRSRINPFIIERFHYV